MELPHATPGRLTGRVVARRPGVVGGEQQPQPETRPANAWSLRCRGPRSGSAPRIALPEAVRTLVRLLLQCTPGAPRRRKFPRRFFVHPFYEDQLSRNVETAAPDSCRG